MPPPETPSLAVVIPCYNEERTIQRLLWSVLQEHVVAEVVVVDDASSDGSAKLVESVTDPRVVLLRQLVNQGKGAAVARGISAVSSPYVVIQDADLEYDPRDLPRLLTPLADGSADAVFGSRFLPAQGHRPARTFHRLVNASLTSLSNVASGLRLTDMETCYKMMRTDLAQAISIVEPRYGIEPELTAKLAASGARITEVPISYSARNRADGKKIGWKDGISAVRCIARYNSPAEKARWRGLASTSHGEPRHRT